ncbi:transporter substrate-binding domain-containing protein [Alphaproteobacteria bacterium]|nr:transporter substrate-binding domain-containing protein [Alphaproteobacteria bacterium]
MYDIIIEQLAPKGYLRAAINLSNFLLVTGTDNQGNPEGVSPDLAKALANELNIKYKLIPFKRPGELADAVTDDVWDIGNIANESERAKSITFSHPYTLIESTFLVRESSKINSLQDVDKKNVRIAVAERSAYDLWLTENIKNAELIRAKSIDLSFKIFEDNSYEVLAGLKPRLIDDLKNTKNCKILPDAFTFIKQCIGSKPGNPEAEKFINNFIEKNTKNGFVESLLLKHNVLGKLSVPAK